MAKSYKLSTGSIRDGEGMQPYSKAIHHRLPSVKENFWQGICKLFKRKVSWTS